MVELWSDGASPQYGPNTASLKPGTVDHSRIAWASYGAKEGAWRLMRILDHHGVPATFSPSGRVFELYPELIRAIHGSGHTLAAHSYTQDTILSQLTPAQERAVIERCVSLSQDVTGARPQSWSSRWPGGHAGGSGDPPQHRGQRPAETGGNPPARASIRRRTFADDAGRIRPVHITDELKVWAGVVSAAGIPRQ